MAIYYTKSTYYQDIANAIRQQNSTSLSLYPSEMASNISSMLAIDKYYNCSWFSSLDEAQAFYNGELGDAIFYPSGGCEFRGTNGFNSTNVPYNTACYEFITSSTTGATHPYSGVYSISGAMINYKMSTGTTFARNKLNMYPNVPYVNSRASTYNGSTDSCQELSVAMASYFGSYTYQSALALKSVNAPNCTIIYDDAFRYAKNLSYINMPNLIQISTAGFQNTSITQGIFSQAYIVGRYAFYKTSISYAETKAVSINDHTYASCPLLRSVYFPNCTAINVSSTRSCNFACDPLLQDFVMPMLTSISTPIHSAFFTSLYVTNKAAQTINIKNWYTPAYNPGKTMNTIFWAAQNNLENVTLGLTAIHSYSSGAVSSNFYQATWISSSYIALPDDLLSYYSFSTASSIYRVFWNASGTLATLPKFTRYQALSTTTGTTINLPFLSILPSQNTDIHTCTYNNTNCYDYPGGHIFGKMDFFVGSAGAQYYQSYFANVEILNLPSITTIPSYCFSGTIGLKGIYCPNCSTIGSNAFYNTRLSIAYFPNVQTIEYAAFGYVIPCSSNIQAITHYTFGSLLENIDPQAFSNTYSAVFSMPNTSYYQLSNNIIYSGSDISAADGPMIIGYQSSSIFSYNWNSLNYTTLTSQYNITEVILPNLSYIPVRCFNDCFSLVSVNLSNTLTIDELAFYWCTNLTTINIPNCYAIYRSAFQVCRSLKSINLPACSIFGRDVFSDCENLSRVNLGYHSLVSTPSYYISSLFYNHPSIFSIYVPASLLSSYQTDSTYGWSYYSSYFVAIPEDE